MHLRCATGLIAATLLAVPLAGVAQDAPPPAVVVATAAMTDLSESASFTGRVAATEKVDIFARVSGFLEDRRFTEGARVAKGDVLYLIQDEDYRAAVTETRGTIAGVEAERRLAEIERDRKAELVRREAVAQAELDIAEAQLGKVDGQLAQLDGSLARAELQLSYTEVTAPFDGITGLSTADVGALVGPETGPLSTLTQLDPIEVVFSVATAIFLDYEARVARGEASREATVGLRLPNGTDFPEPGDINFVSADVDQGTDTVTVRAIFDNPDGVLLDGALVGVTLEGRDTEQVLTVPGQAVQRDQQGAFVMVVGDDDTVEQRRVEVARTTEGLAVISSGLEVGERVVTEGINKVRPGIVVDAAPAQAG